MRVLWFSHTPSLASEFLGKKSHRSGWIESLEKEVSKIKQIELGIAFHYEDNEKKCIEIGATSYYSFPFHSDKGKIRKFWKRSMHDIEPDSIINNYLEVVEKFKPDIIHIFGTEPAFGLIIPHVKVPVVIQIQGNLTVCAKKWFSGLSFIDILRQSNFKNLLKGHGLWHYYFLFVKKSKREQKIFNYCKYFIGRTDWDKRITKAFSSKAAYYHCDEVLREEFYKNIWVEPSNNKIILFSTIGPFTYKGLETILETAAILKNKDLPLIEWQIAGITGKEEIIRIIEKTYKLKFNEQNISFKGSLNAMDLIQSLLKANYFIHPSHIENSPNSVCEAMLLGMPVIATYAGGIPSIIDDKKEGLLVQDGDPYAMAGAIIELIEGTNYAKNLGKNGRNKAVERHNTDKIRAEIQDIYSSIISKD